MNLDITNKLTKKEEEIKYNTAFAINEEKFNRKHKLDLQMTKLNIEDNIINNDSKKNNSYQDDHNYSFKKLKK